MLAQLVPHLTTCVALPTAAAGTYGATLWRTSTRDRDELEPRAELGGHGGVIRSALWRAGGVAATLMTDTCTAGSWAMAAPW